METTFEYLEGESCTVALPWTSAPRLCLSCMCGLPCTRRNLAQSSAHLLRCRMLHTSRTVAVAAVASLPVKKPSMQVQGQSLCCIGTQIPTDSATEIVFMLIHPKLGLQIRVDPDFVRSLPNLKLMFGRERTESGMTLKDSGPVKRVRRTTTCTKPALA